MGPGKADLLDAIRQTGSISAAARSLGMSYRRAWLLVETMNRCFREPLVTTLAGGRHGGGTQLTAMGVQVLRRYRELCDQASAAVQDGLDDLGALLADPVPASQ
jgi:molybdate transport system regulatory protein